MTFGRRILFGLRTFLVAAIVYCLVPGAGGQKPKQGIVLNAPANTSSEVSFVWLAEQDDRFRHPMNLYVVDLNDPRLHTVNVLVEGSWDAYIAAPEMEQVLARLRSFDLKWAESPRREAIVEWESKMVREALEIYVVSSMGAAREVSHLPHLCQMLGEIDPALSSPRVLWQFQLFRVERGCMISNFNINAFPSE